MTVRLVAAVSAVAVGLLGSGQTARQKTELGLAVASFEDVWQTINDSYYDPAFGGVDWPAVRRELLPRAQAALSAEDVRAVIREMIGRLGRSHFDLLSESTALPGAATVPIEIRVQASEVVVTRVGRDTPAFRAGLRPGQVLLAIDGVAADAWRPASAVTDPRARDQKTWEAAFRALHGDDRSKASLRVRDLDGREHAVGVERDEGSGDVRTFGNIAVRRGTLDTTRVRTPGGREVGVIAFNMWMTDVSAAFDSAIDTFRSADGLVIDLRGNPGGLVGMIFGIAGHLLAEPLVLGTMRTRTSPSLVFKANPRFSTADGRRVTPFAGRVAILVDEQTASTSEIFTGALQSLGRARVMGRQTMGQAMPASTKTLPNGDVLLYVVGDFVTTTGRSLEGAGVVPDETVPLSKAALAAGRDAALEAALAWIDRARLLLLCSDDLQDTRFLPRWVAPLMRP